MAISENYVTESQVASTGYVMIALASIVFFGRFGLRVWKSVALQLEDLFVVLSWLSFLAMTILYLIVMPRLYRLTGFLAGGPPYPEFVDDALFIKKIFFCTTLLLWVSLWSVKFSLLVLYRRLLSRLKTEIRLWWVVLIFTVLNLIGCIISNLTSCSSLSAWFSLTGCSSPKEVKAQLASLYYSFAVDVITDIMVMALPVKLLWSLRLPLIQKASLGALFSVGIICIAMATIRVVQIGTKAENNSTPSSSWLAFWGILEAGIAVIIGCLPALAIIYRKERATKRTYGRGYSSMEGYKNKNSIPLSDASSGGNKPLVPLDDYHSAPAPTLSKNRGIGIAVTQQVDVHEEFVSSRMPRY
ncbi:hypothetical protein EMPG_15293 [Blastomyces silverae]|uniref:Rhodopsin domain-containing protein n=1 Tax=Blastomyces silverae TaxID=2060906 RepID=A0A0H1BDY6_9EURO|nr:hypothetical protein EMPG_15293 [Blastomyces silverae]